MRHLRHLLRKPDGGDAGGSEGGAPPAAAPPAAPAPPAASPPAAAPPAAAAPAAPAPPAASPPAAAPAAASPPAAAGADDSAKANWRDDWRETMAKGDAKVLARLQRYASPEAVSDAMLAAQNRISSGDLKPVLKKDSTPEQIAEWRAANGVPETADKYDLGVKVTDGAKALLDVYLPIAHAANMTPDQVKASLGFIAQMNKAENEQRATRDVELEESGEEALRAEWGGEYKRNVTFIHNLLDGAATPEFKDALLGGRLADGTPIGSSPAALRFLMGLALVQNPTGTLVPGFNNNPAQGVEEEITKIETVMKNNRDAYNKDDKMQSRLRDLYDAREKLKPRGA